MRRITLVIAAILVIASIGTLAEPIVKGPERGALVIVGGVIGTVGLSVEKAQNERIKTFISPTPSPF